MSVKMKNSFIGILMVLCLLLSACGNTLPEVAQTQPTETTKATVPTQEQEIDETEPVTKYPEAHAAIPVGDDYLQYGNMQKGGDFILYEDEILFYAMRTSALLSYEMETGKVRTFCIKEDCNHEDSDCVGVSPYGELAQYGGKLYQEHSNLNTVNRIQVLEDGNWEDVTNNSKEENGIKDVITFWYHEDDLYTVTRVGRKLQVYEGGTGEPKTITENFTGDWCMILDGYLYAHRGISPYVPIRQLFRVNLQAETYTEEVIMESSHFMTDGNHIYYIGGLVPDAEPDVMNFPYFLYRCNMDGSNKETLVKLKSVFPASLNFDDEYIYYRIGYEMNGPLNTRDIYRMSKEDPTKIEIIATLPESVYQIFTVPGQNLLFATGATYYEGNNHMQNIYVMNADGSNLRQLELP